MPVSPDQPQIATCPRCGCLVADTSVHDQWHERDAPSNLEPFVDAVVFLAAIDPATLEKAALNDERLPGMGDHGLTRMMLTILGEWASGV